MNKRYIIVIAIALLLVIGYVNAHTENPSDCTVIQNETGIYCTQNNDSTGGRGVDVRYLNVTGATDFYHSNVYNIRNIIGDHLHILTNDSVDSYFNTFSAGNSSNISTIRVSSNATTIASIEQCNTGCHQYNLSWIRVWPNYIDVSSKNVFFTGNISSSNMAGGGIGFACVDDNGTVFKKPTLCVP